MRMQRTGSSWIPIWWKWIEFWHSTPALCFTEADRIVGSPKLAIGPRGATAGFSRLLRGRQGQDTPQRLYEFLEPEWFAEKATVLRRPHIRHGHVLAICTGQDYF